MDERINEFLDGKEEEGYLDAKTHHFPGRFTYEDPELDDPPTPLPGDLISSAMVGDPVLDVTTDKNLVVDSFLDDKSKWFWANYTLICPVIFTRYQYRTKTELIASTEPDFHYFNFVYAIFCGLAVDFRTLVNANLLHAELATSHSYASAVERSPNFSKYCNIV